MARIRIRISRASCHAPPTTLNRIMNLYSGDDNKRANRRNTINSDVFADVSDLSSDATAQQAVYGRFLAEYRCPQPRQFQRPIRAQNSYDLMSRHRSHGLHRLPMGYRRLDSSIMRKVSFLGLLHYGVIIIWLPISVRSTNCHRNAVSVDQ